MQDINNRRFMYNTDACALILGDQAAIRGDAFGSHAEDHGNSGAKEPFDCFIRGWIGIGGQSTHGVIHFAPPASGKNVDMFVAAYNTLQMFRENGAVAGTVVRGFGKEWEQPLSNILPGFTAQTKEKESEGLMMQYFGVWATRSAASVLGSAEAWSKDDGIPIVFTSKEAAEWQAEQYTKNAGIAKVYYYAKEMEPEVAREALDALKTREELAEARDTVYLHPADYAREHGEIHLYRQSNRLNRECAQAIDAAINVNWDGSKLNPEGARLVLKQYGIQRVAMVLANTLSYKDYDLRFSSANREWAKGYPKLEGSGIELNSHPVKLDGFVDQAIRGGLERGGERPSAMEKLDAAKKAVKPPAPGGSGKNKDKGLE
jgi:hypothetical protein